jgi:hypothetical protein
MRSSRRFWIGGAGALLPLLVTLLAADLPGIIDHYGDYTLGTYVGTVLRYVILFAAGGIVAALNSDESSPIKLVQLGIAVPALISSYVNAQAPTTSRQPVRGAMSIFVAPAKALELPAHLDRGPAIRNAGFLDDVFKGALNPLQSILPNHVAIVPSLKEEAEAKAALARASSEKANAAAKKAEAAAEAAAANPSPELQEAARKSAVDAANAAEKATKDSEEATKALLKYMAIPRGA